MEPTTPVDVRIRELFVAHGPALLLYARQWLDRAAAQDVVQDVFVRLIAGGRLPAEPRTWLFRCVRNAAISACRSQGRRGRREQRAGRAAAAAGGWFVPRVDDRIDAEAAQEALASLSPGQREVVTLRIWSGLTLAQVAEVTGMPVSTVHDQYRAALKAVRERLEQPCRNPPP
ncbi:MAG TPA: sigma-70 family RNA polymerase sigma factor [Tepidisphaeraceae bacterium]